MNHTYSVPYSNNYFSELFLDYINGKESLRKYYQYEASIDSIATAIENKKFSDEKRKLLVDVLLEQNASLQLSESSAHNIQSLLSPNTFTITTGHQLGLFTAEWYFIFKILSTVKLAEESKKKNPDFNFVPIFWMATEDHDFEEINHFNLSGHTFTWNNKEKGACGAFSTNGIENIIASLKVFLADRKFANELIEKFKIAYTNTNLSQATRILVNDLLGKFGIVILDANDARLKSLFKEVIKDDLQQHSSFKSVSACNTSLNDLGYATQVNPREINFFYLDKNYRNRIVKNTDGFYETTDSVHQWTRDELMQLVESKPEKFSPNVVLRPLYQEMILPNLAYIGGPGEISYWLQLKPIFENYSTPMPILVWRNSFMLMHSNDLDRWEKIGFQIKNLFDNAEQIANQYVLKHTQNKLSIEDYKNKTSELLNSLSNHISKVNQQLPKSVIGMEKRIERMYSNLEKKILKHEKRNQSEGIEIALNLRSKYFPSGKLQERKENFSLVYSEVGNELFQILYDNSVVFDKQFKVISI